MEEETCPSLDNDRSSIRSFTQNSEAAFSATPLNQEYQSKHDPPLQRADSTFMQDQISFQRSPSAAKERVSALSRTLSAASKDSPLRENRGDPRADSNSESSLIEATGTSLTKSSSKSSAKSGKSVQSLSTVGPYAYGTLRVHSPSPQAAQLSETYSHELLKSGDVLVMRDIPIGSLLGVDTNAFGIQKADEFFGIKDIPSGAHFFWGGSSGGSLRNGFWVMSSKRASDENGDIYVLRWDSYSEVIVEEVSLAEKHIQKDGLPEIFDKLKPYNFASSKFDASQPNIWSRLTSCVKGALLTKITGQEWNHWQVSSAHDLKMLAGQSSAIDDKDNVLNFVFPRATRTFTQSSIGRERSEQAQDTSSHVNAVIMGNCSYEDSDEIIGELQFCYITGMVLGNIACQEQWGHVIKIVFKAYKLAFDDPEFFVKFIDAVLAQFVYDEEGIEGSILDQDPTFAEDLRMALTIFKSRLNELLLSKGADLTPAQARVAEAFESLESFLWKWDWDLRGNYVRSGKIQLEDGDLIDASLTEFEAEDERGEYAPQVIELDEHGREKGLFSL